MGLILEGLRKFGKVIGVIVIACVLYLSAQVLFAFWDSLPNPIKTVAQLREDLSEKTKELEGYREKAASRFSDVVDIERRIQALERSKPPWVTVWPPGTQINKRSLHNAELASLKTAKASAEKARESMLRRQRELEDQVTKLQQQIENTLSTPTGRVASIIQKHWFGGVLVGIGVLFIPMLTRAGWFYAVAPVASSAKPMRLAQASQKLGLVASPVLTCSASTKKLDLTIAPNESLFVRAACLQRYEAQTKKRTQIAWSMRNPFISYSAGLWELTRVDGGNDGASVSIWSGEDADRQLVCVELRDHPGLVFRPRHLVGVIHEPDMLQLRKRWRLNYLHAWCTLQLRYIVLQGTGRAIFWGMGGIEAISPTSGKDCVAQDSVAGFDTRLDYSVRRNETFWHYLRGKEPLFDDCFEGEGQYLVSVASEQGRGIVGVDTWLDRILSLVGKVFGF
jgi:hypothetical protein